ARAEAEARAAAGARGARGRARRGSGRYRLEARLEQDEHGRRDVVRVRVDRDLGLGRGHVSQPARELVRVLFRSDVHCQVAPAPVHAQAFALEKLLELLGLAPGRHVDLDEPVVRAFAALYLLAPLELFALLLIRARERDRGV